MSNSKSITISLTDEEWDFLYGEAHFHQLTIEHYVKHLINLNVVKPLNQANIFSQEHTREAYNHFTQNLQYYLGEAIKIAEGYGDHKMVNVLSKLRVEHIHHQALAPALFYRSNYSI